MPALPDRISGSIKRGQGVRIYPLNAADDEFVAEVSFVDAVGVAYCMGYGPDANTPSGYTSFIPWHAIREIEIVLP